MKRCVNGVMVEISVEEIAQNEEEMKKQEAERWKNTPYDDLVNAEIRKRYSESQEFSILRQKDEKPVEYAEYFRFCEECKTLVQGKLSKVGRYAK